MANEGCPKAGDSLFSSDKHAQLILAQINKMRNGQHFCDVQLQVGKETFKVHRLVLAASSPYFAALFTGGMKESSKDVVQILGIEAAIFRILLDFIYTGIVDIGVNNVQELLVAADMLQLTEVVNLCCAFLKGQIDPLNCIGIFQFSEQIACHDLLEFTENYIHVHFLEVQSGEEFLALTKDQLIKILRSEELSIEDEYQVFLAAMQWLLKDLGKRKKYVVEVLDPIRFPLLPPQRLLKYIEGVSDFNLRVALQTLLKEYCEVCKSPKENKFCSFLQTSKVRPRKKARKYLYAVGGYTRLQGGRWSDSRALSCVERFDTFSQYWTTVSSLHQARCGLGVAVLGGMVYAIGGLIYVIGGISNEGIELRSFEVYDPLSKRWSPLPPMATRRAYLGVAALNDCIYSIGGWNETQDALHTVEKYSFEEEKWVEVASMKVPRAGMCVVAVNGLLYVSGGRSSSHDFLAPGTLDSVEVYNPHSDTWTEIGNMITSRCEGGVAVL
ncbi:actin-binding protein IPP isoform X5 [Myotis yumanensis]|uniref:actin-binding protein IPP isoform X5 n=1 Tax=Myotis yumanensis TaxID=159337 RepID=UPI0038D1B8C1